MLEARRHFDLLVQRPTPDAIGATIEHARSLYLPDQADQLLAEQFQAAADALAGDGTIAVDTRRAWALLRQRVCDDRVSEQLARISDTLVLGATSGGEVSAATIAFPDDSYLIMMDHGLANLTWLVAQLFVVSRRTPLLGHPPPDNPVDVMIAARTLRLATSHIAAGGRAGVNPALVLHGDELALAAVVVSEIDIFIMAHEAAHIMLEHFGARRAALNVVGGSNQLLGRRPREETAADLLAITLQLDDILSVGEGDDRVVGLRLSAVRLFLALLELYERSMFAVQPTSHPPAAIRWRAIVSDRLDHWFDDVDALAPGGVELVTAMQELHTVPRLGDAATVHSGLGKRLDRTLWSFRDWSQVADLGHLLVPTPAEAIAALRRWPGWADATDITAEVNSLVGKVLASEAARDILRAAATSEVVSRLAATTSLTSAAELIRRGAIEHAEPFPSWAIAGLVIDAITATAAGRVDA